MGIYHVGCAKLLSGSIAVNYALREKTLSASYAGRFKRKFRFIQGMKMKRKVNEWLLSLPDGEREHLLKPENKWQLCDRIWNEAIRQADELVRDKVGYHHPALVYPDDIHDLYTYRLST